MSVSAIDDAVDEGTHTGTLSHTAASSDASYNAIAIASVTSNITDNDTADVVITESGGSTDIAEGGVTDTYSIVLDTEPTADVTVNIAGDTQVSAAPTSLVFTPSNWATAQSVSVSAIDDAVDEGTHTGTLSHTAASGDASYNAIAIASVTAGNITDNDFMRAWSSPNPVVQPTLPKAVPLIPIASYSIPSPLQT